MKTYDFDPARHIHDYDDAVAYLNVVLEENDPDELVKAIGTVARSEGMTSIAKRTGLSRESLYKSFGEGGNPKLSTICKVLSACGITLTLKSSERELTLA